MFKNISSIFNSSNKDLRKRLYITLSFLAIFSIGTTITIPWASVLYQNLGFLEIFNVMSGGGLRNFSIFSLGVGPYITASIIMQLLQMDIVPYFKELKDQGHFGKQKINKITRYAAIIMGFFQSYALTIFYLKGADSMMMLKTSLVMTAGTAFCMWMGDVITNKGIGNGQSMIIMAGILQSMPRVFTGAFDALIKTSTYSKYLGITLFSLFILITILVIFGIVWIQIAERRIPIQYANRSTVAYGAHQSFLPIRLNSAGVIPVIFASIISSVPATIVAAFKSEKAMSFVENYILYTSWSGLVIYLLLIMFFGYFYTFMMMNPEEMSKNLNENGGYIPGVRPGKSTAEYISNVLSKITFPGALFLVILAGMPILMSKLTNLPPHVTIGGTGMLIVVGVAIETYKQIESTLLQRSYTSRRKKLR